MTEEVERFRIELEHLEAYQFRVAFDWGQAAELRMDEPAPLGDRAGPNASRLLAAAVANCLSASLLYCLSKHEVAPGALRAQADCRIVRNERGRMRVGGIEVRIQLRGNLEQAPRLPRCLDLFEDFCVVTESIRQGIPVTVEVLGASGAALRPAEHGGAARS